MKKRAIIGLSLLPLVMLVVGCDKGKNIYEPIEFEVKLSEDNVYLEGEEIKFDISGNADYILLYSGTSGSEYKYRNRTEMEVEQLESAKLTMSIKPLYGLAGGLSYYASSSFEGLSGVDAAADYQTMTDVVSGGYDGFDPLTYTEVANLFTEYEYDITDYADGFSLAYHWNPTYNGTSSQRTYYIDVELSIKFEGFDAFTVTEDELNFTTLSMAAADSENRYKSNAGNGSVNYTYTAADIVMSGVGATDLDYALDYWVVSEPRKLTLCSSDTPLDIKSLATDLTSYSYTYDECGEYTATFIARSANIYGASEMVKSVTFTIEPNPNRDPEGDGSLGDLDDSMTEIF